MSGHKIKELEIPVDPGDTLNKEYISARIKAITGVLNGIRKRINNLENIKLLHKMKQPIAPIYLELPSEDGQNYRLQKISEIEKQLIKERDARKALYKKYKRGINLTDGVDTALISTSVIMARIGLAVPVMLPLEVAAIVCGCMGACVKLLRRKLMPKAENITRLKLLERVS